MGTGEEVNKDKTILKLEKRTPRVKIEPIWSKHVHNWFMFGYHIGLRGLSHRCENVTLDLIIGDTYLEDVYKVQRSYQYNGLCWPLHFKHLIRNNVGRFTRN